MNQPPDKNQQHIITIEQIETIAQFIGHNDKYRISWFDAEPFMRLLRELPQASQPNDETMHSPDLLPEDEPNQKPTLKSK